MSYVLNYAIIERIDSSDDKIKEEMRKYQSVRDHMVVVLISGDKDFSSSLFDLRNGILAEFIQVIAVVHSNSDSALRHAATRYLTWQDLLEVA